MQKKAYYSFLKLSVLLYLTGIGLAAYGQVDSLQKSYTTHHYIEVGGLAATSSRSPFWLVTNRHGSIPVENPAAIAFIGSSGTYHSNNKHSGFYLGYGVEGVGATGKKNQIILPEAYARIGFKKIELYAGRRKQIYGIVDTLLSSGSYAWSGNALPIPKVQLGTNGFAEVPFTKGVLAVNAFIAHGWFGNTDSVQGSYLHQKSLFGRIGKPSWKIKLYGGINHIVQWAGSSKSTGSPGLKYPSSLKDLAYVAVAKTPPDDGQYLSHDFLNQVGNHLGSMDVALEWNEVRSSLLFYIQHPFEDKSGLALYNLPDGLYGFRWQNRSSKAFRIKQLTAEYMTTMSQSGFSVDGKSDRYKGADDYFNNYQYTDGWTYRRQIIGTPFFTRWMDARPEWHNLKGGFGRLMISNNRVQLFHLGLLGEWQSGAQVRILLSQSWNYGRPIVRDPATPLSQFSGLTELTLPSKWLGGVQLKAAIAVDKGEWLPNSFGGWVSIRKILLYN